jgi:hypothetical protein
MRTILRNLIAVPVLVAAMGNGYPAQAIFEGTIGKVNVDLQ